MAIKSLTTPRVTPSRLTTFQPWHQIPPVELTILGLGEMLARHKDAGTAQSLGGVAVGDFKRGCHDGIVGMEAGLLDGQHHGTREMLNLSRQAVKNQSLAANRASGALLKAYLKPLIPQASAMRPTSMASAGKLVA